VYDDDDDDDWHGAMDDGPDADERAESADAMTEHFEWLEDEDEDSMGAWAW
jgi:hypothetical protein